MQISKTILLSVAGIATVAAIAIGTTAQASGRSFTLDNSNSYASIDRVWTAQAGTNDAWNEANVNAPITDSSDFTMDGKGSSCLFDVRIEFSDGVVQTFSGVNVCRGDRLRAD